MLHPTEQRGFALHLLGEQLVHCRLGSAVGPQPAALLLGRDAPGLEQIFVPRRRHRDIHPDQIAPFHASGVVQRGDVRLPRLRVIRRAGLVGHVRRVVLVGQSGEVMTELVDEHVLGEPGVGRRRCLKIEDPATAILRLVDENLEKLVRGRRRRVPEGSVVVGQDVALRIEDVVLGRQRRPTELPGAWPADTGLGRWQVEPPHVEVTLPAPERLLVEQRVHEPGRIGMELGDLCRGVALADHQQVDLLGRRAVLEQRPDLAHRLPVGRVDKPRVRVDHDRPDLVEAVLGIAGLQHYLDRRLRPGEPQRLTKAPVDLPGLGGGLPLAVDRREPTRVQDPVRSPVEHFEQILPQVQTVDQPRAATGPRPVRDHLVQPDDLLTQPARVDVVDPHRLAPEEGVEVGRRLTGGLATKRECDGQGGGEAGGEPMSRASHGDILAARGGSPALHRDR